MYYAPHTLQVLRKGETDTDQYGWQIGKATETWLTLCPCRCDDNTTQDITTDNGRVYRPTYKIVVSTTSVDVKVGERVRAIYADGQVRGEGQVTQITRTNYLEYSTLWL